MMERMKEKVEMLQKLMDGYKKAIEDDREEIERILNMSDDDTEEEFGDTDTALEEVKNIRFRIANTEGRIDSLEVALDVFKALMNNELM